MNLQDALQQGGGYARHSKGARSERLTVYATNGNLVVHQGNRYYGDHLPEGVGAENLAWYPEHSCPRDPSRDQVLELGTGDECDCMYHKPVL